ncbi:hypothetical protein MTR67_014882 [Solanum verrucosum]|uniref:Uncharacterized protein n=1 Tax=Solanum verrucosum TaxID=315347 RepID=A0AAF0QER2_SOLVR|nr:hypothetical protein MTR67_014882 [Solanum verrucosum]
MAAVSLKLKGKVAIVTGGASGIEEATARLFAIHGAQSVVIANIQDEKSRACGCIHPFADLQLRAMQREDENQVKAMMDWWCQ